MLLYGMKTKIIDATLRVLGQGQAVAFSMRDVAKAAGITPTEIYRHFQDKDALSQALVEEARRLLSAYQIKALNEATPLERLWKTGRQYVCFAIDYPQLYQLLFVRPISGSAPHFPDEMGPEHDLPFQMVVDRVRESIACSDLKKGDPAGLALIAWAQAHGLCMLHHSGRFNAAQLRLMSDQAFADLLNGIGNSPAIKAGIPSSPPGNGGGNAN